MSGWDVISDVFGRMVSGAVLGPPGFLLNPAGDVFRGMTGGGPERTYAEGNTGAGPVAPGQHPPPYPGTSPNGEGPYPGTPWPPPPGGADPNHGPAAPPQQPVPPGNPGSSSGQASDAEHADAAQLDKLMKQLDELDKKAAATVDAVHAAGAASQKALQDMAHDVDAKIKELGPRLNTAEGQQELRDYLKERLESAKQLIEQQIADAEKKARETRDLANQYNELGGDNSGSDNGGSGGGGSDHSGGGGGGGDPVGTTPASSTSPAASPTGQPAMGTSPFGTGMPGGMPMSMPSLPSFGGGGMPGMGGGFGDPLSSLGALGNNPPGAEVPHLQDDSAGGDHSKSGDNAPQLHDDAADTGSGTDHGKPATETTAATDHGQDQGTHPAGDSNSAGTDPAGTVTGAAAHADSGTQVDYVDDKGNEVKTDARNDVAAAAARAHIKGASVAQAYSDHNIELPPPGTPISDPKLLVPPNLLKAGDVGIFKDHYVMALGNAKVLVSGQVQSLDSISSGPDFLAWIDPTAAAGHAGAAPAPAGQQNPPARPNAT